MTRDDIKVAILNVCKVPCWDGDFNVVGFHALCDKLEELGAAAEREACAKVCDELDDSEYRTDCGDCAAAIRARESSSQQV